MDDSQAPDAENSKGDPARRSLRLRDAEAVATNRRDMFGDGSLIDALAGAPRDEESPAAGPPAADAPAAEDAAAARVAPEPAPALAEESMPGEAAADGAAAEPAQSLDAIIDSFSPDQTSREEAPLELQAEPGDLADGSAGQFQVSAIFAGLGDPGSQGHDAGDPPVDGSDGAADTASGAASGDDGSGAEPKPAAGPTPGLGVPLFAAPHGGSAPMPPPSDWPPLEPETDEGGTGPAAFDQSPDGLAPYPEPSAWPPFPEMPGFPGPDSGVAPLAPPSLVTAPEPTSGAAGSPFPGPPAWPPFPESPGGGTGHGRAEPSRLPPYIELPADPEQTGRAAGPQDGDPPPQPGATADSFRYHGLDADGPTDADAGAPADASAKIAAEADATALALDNLQRLLSQTIAPATPPPSQPQAPPLPRGRNARLNLPPDDPYHVASMLPLPMEPPERAGPNVYLLGFITGLVLSVMAGAALYFLIKFD